MNKNKLYEEFFGLFTSVDLPILLSEDTIEEIKTEAEPISNILLQEIMSEIEPDMDEFTEIIPCLSLKDTELYKSLIYWKASLLRYEFIIITLDIKTYKLISKKSICGIKVEGDVIKKSAARIDEDRIIHIIVSAMLEGQEYNPEQTQAFYMEMMNTGEVLFHNEDNI